MRKTRCVRGIVHVHTAGSRDGFLSPWEIADMCEGQGLSFAAITDHVEDMTPSSMERLVADCAEHSQRGFVLIPGLEHRFARGIHILSLGQYELTPPGKIIQTLRLLANQDGVLIAAHCKNSRDIPGELLELLTAIEVWNIGRDTRYLPTSAAIRAYFRCLPNKPDLLAIGGLDLHRGREWGCEVMVYLSDECSPDAILSALRRGDFATTSRLFSFSSRPSRTTGILAFRVGDVLSRIRSIRDTAEAALGVNVWYTKRRKL